MAATRGDRSRAMVDAVEQLYVDDGDEPRWLQEFIDALRPAIDRGMGVFAYPVDPHVWPPKIGASVHTGVIRDDWRARATAVQETLAGVDEAERACRPRPMATTASATLGKARWVSHPLVREHLVSVGIADFLLCFAPRDAQHVFTIGVPVPAVGRLSRIEALSIGRIAVHLGAAFRLRSRRRFTPGSDDGEAVLSPTGKVEHAESAAKHPSALEALRTRAVELEAARGPLRRRDPSRALDLWRALVEGRWSLVERFERDGRRFYIAKENTPDAPGPPGLTDQERRVVGLLATGHSNKLAAYALGLSEPSVSAHVRAAMAKLNVASRAELVQLAMTASRDRVPSR